jgi:hypothetical protein
MGSRTARARTDGAWERASRLAYWRRWSAPDVDLAGLAGLFAGVIFGLAALAVGAGVSFVVGRRRNKPILRGAALGTFVATGVAAITLGICAAVS